MPAKLVITSGLSAGAEFWIEEDVLRIGSDSKCQFCLRDAGLAPHAATLEYRNGAYVIHNRGAQPVILGGRPVAPRAVKSWPAGVILQLADTVGLRLDVEGNAAPAPRPAPRHSLVDGEGAPEASAAPESSAVEEAPAAPPNGSKQLLQIAVIALCVVLGGAMLLVDSSAPRDAPTRNVLAEFNALIQELNRQKPTANLDPAELRAVLQSARMAQLRGDRQRSQELYGHLRDLLLARRKRDGTFASPVEGKVWDFVESQLKPPETDSESQPKS